MRLRLSGLTDLSFMEWPGRVVARVLFQGCDFRCPWCQNISGIEVGGGRPAELRMVARRLKEFVPMLDSVMATGGEPLLQPRGCLELLKRAKKLKLGCGIKSNGTNPRKLEKLIPYLDFITIYVQAPFTEPKLYSRMVGRRVTAEVLQRIKESLRIAIGSGAEVEARTTIVPTLNDRKDIIEEIALDVAGVDRLRLLQFRNVGTLDPSFQELHPPSRKKLLKLARAAKRSGLSDVRILTIGGGLEAA
jgi:pyruvate formate lyase activating enzyme